MFFVTVVILAALVVAALIMGLAITGKQLHDDIMQHRDSEPDHDAAHRSAHPGADHAMHAFDDRRG